MKKTCLYKRLGILYIRCGLFILSGRNGAMDGAPDCYTIRGAVARFESLAKHSVY